MSIPFALTSIVTSNDGSHTLKNESTGEHYHSLFGAVTESSHVFVEAGLQAIQLYDKPCRLLEIGMGTGLNLFLTAVFAQPHSIRIDYTGLEPYPVQPEILKQLNYGSWVNEGIWESFCRNYEAMLTGESWEQDGLSAKMDLRSVHDFETSGVFDLIFYDAFSPKSQAEMWSDEVVDKLGSSLAPGGVLVTYCVQGRVRRRFMANGLMAERLPGPPGKRQMLRIIKP